MQYNIDTLIESFKEQTDDDFEKLLVESLNKADDLAKNGGDEQPPLNAELYTVLSWPTTVGDYLEFLVEFSRWVPKQTDCPAWLNPDTNGHQEVYDRLCHFYFLINHEVGPDSIIVQDIEWFSEWLVKYSNEWGNFLNTTESFNDDILQSFIDLSPEYRVEDSMVNGEPNNPSGWLTFNQFFARELNPGLRPISRPADNAVPVMPADCTFKAMYPIDSNSEIPGITVKQTHDYASIPHLIKGSQYEEAFAGGTFVHYFLGPYSYHRFHMPVAGVLKECYAERGLVYLDVNLSDGQFDAPDSSEGGYEFYQARGVVTIDTTGSKFGDLGIVAVIPVGMCHVSSVNMIAQPGAVMQKGEEFGFFLFGGSDIILLFQEGKVNPDAINTDTSYRHYGTPILAS